ncbi:glutathione S-transferase [Kaistia algarum]|uniref:glutathione S-transferase family protein n=1 Tax=Kaistia algarum TaxID=2083279 RepID=UPI000CE8FE26|nr:glutathione S-transferase family protein [Kaistia algarum]MCX5513821.1 glutathione S-transferase family protein [Kaistia algarum]PPE79525.1 glutathione S-transferase [Kaistia algarum]
MAHLHHHPFSAASRFVRLVLAEYDETAEFIEEKPWVRNPALLTLNPAGTLPVLIDDNETVVCGGSVIAEYLVETKGARMGEMRLMPDHATDRAEVRRLVEWFSRKLNGEVTDYLVTEKVYKRRMTPAEGKNSPDPAAIRAARANIRYHLQYIGYLAGRRNWLAGRELTLADFAAAAEISCIDYLGEVPWEADETAKAWYARIKSRPSFRSLLTDTLRGVPASTHYADLDF